MLMNLDTSFCTMDRERRSLMVFLYAYGHIGAMGVSRFLIYVQGSREPISQMSKLAHTFF